MQQYFSGPLWRCPRPPRGEERRQHLHQSGQQRQDQVRGKRQRGGGRQGGRTQEVRVFISSFLFEVGSFILF